MNYINIKTDGYNLPRWEKFFLSPEKIFFLVREQVFHKEPLFGGFWLGNKILLQTNVFFAHPPSKYVVKWAILLKNV